MKNPIMKIFSDLTDMELVTAIHEIQQDEPNGIIRANGYVRKLNQKVMEITNETNYSVHLTSVVVGLFKEAAYRYAKSNESMSEMW